MLKRISTILIISGTIFLSACQNMLSQSSNQAPLNQHIAWKDRETQLKTLNQWKIHGKIGGKVTIQQKTQDISAELVWEQNNNTYDVHLFGPFGSNMVRIFGDLQNASLITYSENETISHNARYLLKEKTGLDLPVTDLYYWVRGLPAPKLHATLHFDTYNHLTSLEQDGFKIQYLNYTAVNNRVDLPSLLAITGKNTSVRISIKDWYLDS
jgi:outer membrane lipoprotein LolB